MASPPLAQRGRGGFFHRQPAFVIRQKARETRRIGSVRLLHAALRSPEHRVSQIFFQRLIEELREEKDD